MLTERISLACLVSSLLLVSACTGETSADGTGTATDTDTTSATTSTSSDATTSPSTTSPTSTTSTTDPTTTSGGDNDYWDMNVCKGADSPSSDDCMDVDFAGQCDMEGKVIYCEDNKLYCINCPANNAMCEYVEANMWYDCVSGGSTTDPTTSTGTGTSTSTGG